MASSLFEFLSRPLDRASAIGKPVLAGGVTLTERATRQIGDMLGVKANPRYRAFISYSHGDMAFARWLHRAIENYRIPKDLIGTVGEHGDVPAKLRPIFRDEDELGGAAELGPELENALASSGALIVICSPAAARSAWVDKEIRTFKRINRGAPVFAVIATGTPGDPDQECFPQSLLYALGDDGMPDRARPLEPLAPDLQKLGRQTVKLKLIAGLLGVSYTHLYRRDRKRARRLAAVAGTAGLMLILVLSGLSIVAVSYARIAVKERNEAQAARRLAEENAEKAERRAWLAQTAAMEVRRQADLLAGKEPACPPVDGGR